MLDSAFLRRAADDALKIAPQAKHAAQGFDFASVAIRTGPHSRFRLRYPRSTLNAMDLPDESPGNR
jgi:hypothetical protein